MDLEGRILALSDRGLNGQSELISAVLPAGRYVVEVRSLVFSFPSGVIIDMNQAKGLSLAEVMIVMAIIALSVGLVGPRIGAGMTRIEVYQAEQTIRSFVEMAWARAQRSNLAHFVVLNRRGPTVTLVGPDGQLLEEARRRVEEGEALLLRGDNPSLASAELQAVIEEVAEATGIELGQRNMSAARQKHEFFNEITMSLGFECTPGQLVAFLEQLRGSEKLLAVRSIPIAPLSVVDEVSEGMEVLKDVRVNLTVGAVLASPPAGEPAEG